MNEWAVVGVVITLVTFLIAIITPLLKLNTTITTLNTLVRNIEQSLDSLSVHNTKSHERIWEHNDGQDAKIANHETRISVMEQRNHH